MKILIVVHVSLLLQKRIFWLTIVVVCFIFCNILVASFWIRYKSSPTVMRIGSSHNPLSTLKLPAITFCHTNRVSTIRAMALINRLYVRHDSIHPFSF